ncbi:MAG: tRNA 2-thiouridine(34) synthase MnmA [Campylobacter sp.]|nr:tRNA 2-thiouridine(34) synthase MnmA [Campylobacter sp.]
MKILVAMSGGVDSSMTAKILKDAGNEVQGCYMRLHKKPGYHEENIRKVKKVGEFLGIKTHILDLEDEFEEMVYKPFVSSYKNGLTPNPCALCNRYIKLGKLLEFAKSLGCEKLATGHYVRVEDSLLKVAIDLSKDQSYFLANIDPASLPFMIFPLGGMYKSEVKAMARNYPELIEIAGQKESSEICFVETTYIDILKRHFDPDMLGIVKDKDGNKVGKHDGYMHYTIGKRRGFSVDGAHEPHYVTSINPNSNEITVGTKDELDTYNFNLKNFNNFLSFEKIKNMDKIYAKIRYRSKKLEAKFDNNFKSVHLKTPASGVASGQLAVFYDEFDRVVASGFIA